MGSEEEGFEKLYEKYGGKKQKKFYKWLILIIVVIGIVVLVYITHPLFLYPRTEEEFEGPIFKNIDVSDVFCSEGSISLTVRNVGTDTIDISELKFYLDDIETTPSLCSGSISSGSGKLCKLGTGLTGMKSGSVVGPNNTVKFNAFCV